ncbi:MAG: hypothetical protein CL843_14035 [Crocinitomicaceae bacterium]|nr:hypothetical protein [Crocinitomicaceae bacterium]|tara:strand:- start:4317 stop:4925 length:609 start_codon:yes stop_codon:yes gene_type:complete
MMNTNTPSFDLLIADTQPIFRLGIKSLLSKKHYISRIHEADTPKKCISMAELYHPNLVILDETMEKAEKEGCIYAIQQLKHTPEIILLQRDVHTLTNPKQPRCINKSLKANDFIARLEEIMNIRDASMLTHSGSKNPFKLGKRELEVINLLCKSMSSKEIADQLCISKSTVDNHRKNILRKTGFYNTAGVVQWAVKYGLPSG